MEIINLASFDFDESKIYEKLDSLSQQIEDLNVQREKEKEEEKKAKKYDPDWVYKLFYNLELPEDFSENNSEIKLSKQINGLINLNSLSYVTNQQLVDILMRINKKNYNLPNIFKTKVNTQSNFVYCGPVLININPGANVAKNDRADYGPVGSHIADY